MAKFYLRARNTALKLLSKYGVEFAVMRKGGVFVDENGKEHVQLDGRFDTVGVRKDYQLNEIDGSLIQAGDIRIVFAPDKEIRIGDLVKIDGKDYRVQKPNPVKPANTVLCYQAQLRG